MRRSYRISIERRVRSESLSDADFLRMVRLVHRVESEIRKDRRCICHDLGCRLKTNSSFCHVHRNEESVSDAVDQLRARVESIALDLPALGSRAFVQQVALEERLRMALEDAKEFDIAVEEDDERAPLGKAVAA